jgi:hypothetical protein
MDSYVRFFNACGRLLARSCWLASKAAEAHALQNVARVGNAFGFSLGSYNKLPIDWQGRAEARLCRNDCDATMR